jgi:hypothetical protein
MESNKLIKDIKSLIQIKHRIPIQSQLLFLVK